MRTFEEIEDVVDSIKLDMVGMHIRFREQGGACMYLQIAYNGKGAWGIEPWSGRKWLISSHMTNTEIVNTAWLAYKQAIEHELLEKFTFRGYTVKNPHMAVEDIATLLGAGSISDDCRDDAMQGA